jgi:hypothetical protein
MLKLDNVTLVMIDSLDDYCDKSNIRIAVLSKILPKMLEGVQFGNILSINPFNKNKHLIDKNIEQLIWKRNTENVSHINWYCEFVVSKLPYLITTDYYLIMQWDGFIMNPNKWRDLFFNYDYIGGGHTLLNGGFSLRKTETMRRIVESGNPQIISSNGVSSEDELYSSYFDFPPEFQKRKHNVPFHMEWPDENILNKFCSFMEIKDSFGWHRNSFLSIHSIMNQYKSLNIFSDSELKKLKNFCLLKETMDVNYDMKDYSIDYNDNFFNY